MKINFYKVFNFKNIIIIIQKNLKNCIKNTMDEFEDFVEAPEGYTLRKTIS